MKILLIVLTFLMFSLNCVLAQFTNFNTQKNWSMHKKEVIFGGGATQFLGDLGGGPGTGKDYSLADLNFRNTNFNVTLGYRYRFRPSYATTTSINFGKYSADDNVNGRVNAGRAVREISIKSFLASISQRFEYLIYVNEKVGKRNNIPGLKGMKDKNTQLYIYAGIGIAYFNPQGDKPGSQFDGEFLRPLSTEGQGYAGGTKRYLPITAIIPMGIGYRFNISRMWRMAIEATYNKTFTDYMDDVSGTYYRYSTNGVTPAGGQAALYYTNPSEDWSNFKNGDKRGEKQKDAFFYVNVTFAKNITFKSYQRGKPIKWRGVRAKF